MSTDSRTIDQMSDEELAGQPAGFWTGVAYESVIGFIRAEQARHGYTQPQFWLLRNLSPDDLSPDGHARTVPELTAAMHDYLRPEDDLAAEAEVLLARGWLRREGDRLSITRDGEAGRQAIKRLAPQIAARIHAGIDDADYVAALKVLGRLIQNTSDRA